MFGWRRKSKFALVYFDKAASFSLDGISDPNRQPGASSGKKRPGSPAVSGAQQAAGNSNPSGGKKKKPPLPATPTTQTQITAVETVAEMKTVASVDSAPTTTESTAKLPPFKDNTFMGSVEQQLAKKNRTWKNLKQILALERTLPWKLNDPNYYNIDAPPSLKPAKKYSDISGLPANYTDPQTKLRFTSSEEFSYIRLLPTDVVTGYLTLRRQHASFLDSRAGLKA